MKKVNAYHSERQKARRERWRASGDCTACGGARDRLPRLTCTTCAQAVLRSVARRQPGCYVPPEPVVKPVPAVLKVHPRIPVPLKGSIAMNLVRGTHRRAA